METKEIKEKISHRLEQAKRKIATLINQEMIVLYWNIGKMLKEEIIRARTGGISQDVIVQSISKVLNARYGKLFSTDNLLLMLKAYELYPVIHLFLAEFMGLTWSHVVTLLSIKDRKTRKCYATLCKKHLWDVKTLQMKIKDRICEKDMDNMDLLEGHRITPEDVFADPRVRDLLNL